MLYFTYGSNMDWHQMKCRCPSARFVGIAELKQYRLDFTYKSKRRCCAVADIVRDDNETVWGVVYTISELDVGRLDKAEGYRPQRCKNAYRRIEVMVFEDGCLEKPLRVWTYEVCCKGKPDIPPSQEYRTLLLQGARYWHLPAQWTATLGERLARPWK